MGVNVRNGAKVLKSVEQSLTTCDDHTGREFHIKMILGAYNNNGWHGWYQTLKWSKHRNDEHLSVWCYLLERKDSGERHRKIEDLRITWPMLEKLKNKTNKVSEIIYLPVKHSLFTEMAIFFLNLGELYYHFDRFLMYISSLLSLLFCVFAFIFSSFVSFLLLSLLLWLFLFLYVCVSSLQIQIFALKSD